MSIINRHENLDSKRIEQLTTRRAKQKDQERSFLTTQNLTSALLNVSTTVDQNLRDHITYYHFTFSSWKGQYARHSYGGLPILQVHVCFQVTSLVRWIKSLISINFRGQIRPFCGSNQRQHYGCIWSVYHLMVSYQLYGSTTLLQFLF